MQKYLVKRILTYIKENVNIFARESCFLLSIKLLATKRRSLSLPRWGRWPQAGWGLRSSVAAAAPTPVTALPRHLAPPLFYHLR